MDGPLGAATVVTEPKHKNRKKLRITSCDAFYPEALVEVGDPSVGKEIARAYPILSV